MKPVVILDSMSAAGADKFSQHFWIIIYVVNNRIFSFYSDTGLLKQL